MFTLTPFSTQEPDIFDYFNAFDHAFHTLSTPQFAQCKTDICESGNQFILSAELPGFAKEDIKIDLKDNILTITAVHPEEKTCSEDKESTQEESQKNSAKPSVNYIRRERRNYNYKRSFNIDGIDTENIKASYTNGILELTLPKIMPKEPSHIKIDVA